MLAEATLVKVEGRRLIFTVSAARLEGDGGGLVGAGRVTRVVLDRAAFLAKAGAAEQALSATPPRRWAGGSSPGWGPSWRRSPPSASSGAAGP